jgi:vacuolar-type H+-ATPase subunit D/Vma8
MINPEPQPTREELLKRVEELEASLTGKSKVLEMASESLQSYKRQIADTKESVKALAHEHADDTDKFYNEVIELFDIELTKMVTVQMTVSIEVQATVPANLDDDEVAEELTNATLDYSFFGNGDIVIEDWSFGNLEVE